MLIKEKRKIDVFAGMPTNGKGSNKIGVVGHKVVEFVYEVDPKDSGNKTLISFKEISRKFF